MHVCTATRTAVKRGGLKKPGSKVPKQERPPGVLNIVHAVHLVDAQDVELQIQVGLGGVMYCFSNATGLGRKDVLHQQCYWAKEE